MQGALAGIRVVDFTEYIAGPYCTMMLADMGADVVKVEKPEGDAWRHTAPVGPYESRASLGVNRGKRSISIDMDREQGREIVQRLVNGADVLVQNYRPGVSERLGIDYEALRDDNPRLIYCQNSAFGHRGPYQNRPGFDLLSQATTGMILYENKLDHGLPTYVSTFALADVSSGMFMAYAIVSALYARMTTGQGQRIDTSLFASGLAVQYRPLLSVESVDRPVREGFLGELAAAKERGLTWAEADDLRSQYIPTRGRNNYYRVYEARDGLLAVACLNNRQRRALRDLLVVADSSIDGPLYDWFSEEVRIVHHETRAAIEAGFRERDVDDWLAELDRVDVPCAPLNFPEEMFDHPHVAANGLLPGFDHPLLGSLRMPASPIAMTGSISGTELPPPALGQHSAAILAELGYEDAAVTELFADRVVRSVMAERENAS